MFPCVLCHVRALCACVCVFVCVCVLGLVRAAVFDAGFTHATHTETYSRACVGAGVPARLPPVRPTTRRRLKMTNKNEPVTRPGQSRAPARPVTTEPQTIRQEFHAAHSHATPKAAPAAVHAAIESIDSRTNSQLHELSFSRCLARCKHGRCRRLFAGRAVRSPRVACAACPACSKQA